MARRGNLWTMRGMWSSMGSTAPAPIVVDVEILTMTQGETLGSHGWPGGPGMTSTTKSTQLLSIITV